MEQAGVKVKQEMRMTAESSNQYTSNGTTQLFLNCQPFVTIVIINLRKEKRHLICLFIMKMCLGCIGSLAMFVINMEASMVKSTRKALGGHLGDNSARTRYATKNHLSGFECRSILIVLADCSLLNKNIDNLSCLPTKLIICSIQALRRPNQYL